MTKAKNAKKTAKKRPSKKPRTKSSSQSRKVSARTPRVKDTPSGGGILSEYPPLMTRVQVQEALQISRATFFRMVEDGKMPGAKKVGGSWRVVREKLEAWLAE